VHKNNLRESKRTGLGGEQNRRALEKSDVFDAFLPQDSARPGRKNTPEIEKIL
jgi:hypothetical protein